ncbi:hypothetical protein B0H14DRAFT_3472447 [Mycena olivaceomarginata]|nr:hypothetical protein B0H14DRAFT_3472447 [Mycena olivaceomarginata]
MPDTDSADEAEHILTLPSPPLHTTHQLAEGDRLSLLLPEHSSIYRRNQQAVPEAPNIFQGRLALCLARAQRQLVSSAEVHVLLPYMHPETPHDISCPPGNTCDRMAPLEMWEVVEEGYSQPSPTSYLSCTLLLAPRLETGHISYIRSFIGVLPLTPPSAGSLLTGPGVTYSGFLN